MANNSVNLTSLDFDVLKDTFKTYLQTQSIFKDYDFSGSNMNVLLDILSHNSHLNAFYLNMVASEMFLDSAQKLDTVVSHAKELNYTPRSSTSAVANISFTAVTNGISLPFTIPEGTLFSGTNSNGTFNFTTRTETTYTSPNNVYSVDNLQIYEGLYVNNSFVMDRTNETLRFVLTNENIDLNSLSVIVYENNLQDEGQYIRAETLFGLTNSSNVFFVQACENGRYEILFGDGFLGYRPTNESLIVAKYMVTSGADADGISEFSISSDLSADNSGSVIVTNLETVTNSRGGANSESIESIRFYAPRYFATQQRAVASDDYSSLILSKFGGTISDVNVYGGEQLEPKQYGRVVICLKSNSGEIVPNFIKSEIKNYMLDYVSLPTRVIITDPDIYYIKIDSEVQYNKSITTKLPNSIINLIRESIVSYNTENLGAFEEDFRYSKFTTVIDNSDESITSNNTEVSIIKRLTPKANTPTSYNIEFGNVPYYDSSDTDPSLTSSYFTYVDSDGVHHTLCQLKDIQGTIVIFKYINGIYTEINSNIGTLNYETGTVNLVRLHVSDYSNYISLYLKLSEKDIVANKSRILSIDLNDCTISVKERIR